MKSNGYNLCDVSIVYEAVQILDAEIETAYQNSVGDGGLMESSDLGFEFYDDFVTFELSAGDDAASSANDESIPLFEILSDTLNKLVADADVLSEANKRDLDMKDDNNEGSATRIDNEAHKK